MSQQLVQAAIDGKSGDNISVMVRPLNPSVLLPQPIYMGVYDGHGSELGSNGHVVSQHCGEMALPILQHCVENKCALNDPAFTESIKADSPITVVGKNIFTSFAVAKQALMAEKDQNDDCKKLYACLVKESGLFSDTYYVCHLDIQGNFVKKEIEKDTDTSVALLNFNQQEVKSLKKLLGKHFPRIHSINTEGDNTEYQELSLTQEEILAIQEKLDSLCLPYSTLTQTDMRSLEQLVGKHSLKIQDISDQDLNKQYKAVSLTPAEVSVIQEKLESMCLPFEKLSAEEMGLLKNLLGQYFLKINAINLENDNFEYKNISLTQTEVSDIQKKLNSMCLPFENFSAEEMVSLKNWLGQDFPKINGINTENGDVEYKKISLTQTEVSDIQKKLNSMCLPFAEFSEEEMVLVQQLLDEDFEKIKPAEGEWDYTTCILTRDAVKTLQLTMRKNAENSDLEVTSEKLIAKLTGATRSPAVTNLQTKLKGVKQNEQAKTLSEKLNNPPENENAKILSKKLNAPRTNAEAKKLSKKLVAESDKKMQHAYDKNGEETNRENVVKKHFDFMYGEHNPLSIPRQEQKNYIWTYRVLEKLFKDIRKNKELIRKIQCLGVAELTKHISVQIEQNYSANDEKQILKTHANRALKSLSEQKSVYLGEKHDKLSPHQIAKRQSLFDDFKGSLSKSFSLSTQADYNDGDYRVWGVQAENKKEVELNDDKGKAILVENADKKTNVNSSDNLLEKTLATVFNSPEKQRRVSNPSAKKRITGFVKKFFGYQATEKQADLNDPATRSAFSFLNGKKTDSKSAEMGNAVELSHQENGTLRKRYVNTNTDFIVQTVTESVTESAKVLAKKLRTLVSAKNKKILPESKGPDEQLRIFLISSEEQVAAMLSRLTSTELDLLNQVFVENAEVNPEKLGFLKKIFDGIPVLDRKDEKYLQHCVDKIRPNLHRAKSVYAHLFTALPQQSATITISKKDVEHNKQSVRVSSWPAITHSQKNNILRLAQGKEKEIILPVGVDRDEYLAYLRNNRHQVACTGVIHRLVDQNSSILSTAPVCYVSYGFLPKKLTDEEVTEKQDSFFKFVLQTDKLLEAEKTALNNWLTAKFPDQLNKLNQQESLTKKEAGKIFDTVNDCKNEQLKDKIIKQYNRSVQQSKEDVARFINQNRNVHELYKQYINQHIRATCDAHRNTDKAFSIAFSLSDIPSEDREIFLSKLDEICSDRHSQVCVNNPNFKGIVLHNFDALGDQKNEKKAFLIKTHRKNKPLIPLAVTESTDLHCTQSQGLDTYVVCPAGSSTERKLVRESVFGLNAVFGIKNNPILMKVFDSSENRKEKNSEQADDLLITDPKSNKVAKINEALLTQPTLPPEWLAALCHYDEVRVEKNQNNAFNQEQINQNKTMLQGILGDKFKKDAVEVLDDIDDNRVCDVFNQQDVNLLTTQRDYCRKHNISVTSQNKVNVSLIDFYQKLIIEYEKLNKEHKLLDKLPDQMATQFKKFKSEELKILMQWCRNYSQDNANFKEYVKNLLEKQSRYSKTLFSGFSFFSCNRQSHDDKRETIIKALEAACTGEPSAYHQ